MEDVWAQITAQLKIFIGSLGASFAALVGISARYIYSENAFSSRRFIVELPAAIFFGLIANGFGQFFSLPEPAIFAISCGAAYLGPEFMREVLTKIANKKIGKDE